MDDIQDFVYCLAASPNYKKDGSTFAAKKSGLFRSMNGGKTWSDSYTSLKLTAPLPTVSVVVAAINKITYTFAAVEGRVLRSLDGGKKWEVAELDSPAPLVTALAISPDFARDGLVLAATLQDGVFFSSDRGVKWHGWNFGLYDHNINALAFIDAQTILCGTQSGIFVSGNAGRSWRDLDFPIDSVPVLCLAVSREKTIYAGTQADGLMRSRDEGNTWQQVIAGVVEHIIIDPDGKILILRDGKLQQSKDNGKTWRARAGLKTDSAVTCLCAPLGLDSTNSVVVGLADGEIITL